MHTIKKKKKKICVEDEISYMYQSISPAPQSITNTPFKSSAHLFLSPTFCLSKRGILLPSIEIVHEPSKSRDLCDCLRDYASHIRSLTCMYIRRNCAFLSSGRDSGWGSWGRGREGNGRMEKLGTIGMLIRFARFLGRFVLFCECRSSAADAASWNAFRGRARGRKNKGADDYEYISFTISRRGSMPKCGVILLCSSCDSFIREKCA